MDAACEVRDRDVCIPQVFLNLPPPRTKFYTVAILIMIVASTTPSRRQHFDVFPANCVNDAEMDNVWCRLDPLEDTSIHLLAAAAAAAAVKDEEAKASRDNKLLS